MFRVILSSRSIITGLVFFVLIVGGSLLYSWHVRRTSESDMERHDRFLRGREKQNATRPIESVRVQSPNETTTVVETPTEPDASIATDATPELPSDSEFVDAMDAFLPDDIATEAPAAEEVPVSPFGFGPYPEVPDDYFGIPVWMQNADLPDHTQKNVELIDRVLVKLWQQGDKAIVGGSTYSGKVYPHYEDTVYIRWTESTASDGTPYRYISRRKGASLLPTSEDIENGDIPPGFKIIELDDAGYDPYTFLDLQ